MGFHTEKVAAGLGPSGLIKFWIREMEVETAFLCTVFHGVPNILFVIVPQWDVGVGSQAWADWCKLHHKPSQGKTQHKG